MTDLCRCPVMDKLEKELEEPITSTQTWLIKSVGLLFCKAIQDYASDTTVKPVRHGKWIFNPSDAVEAMFAKPKCSECGFESADGGNYCSECGARMDEE